MAKVFSQGIAPVLGDGIALGDIWIQSGTTTTTSLCTQLVPSVVFTEVRRSIQPSTLADAVAVPAGGVGALAGAWDTAGNRDTAITRINNLVSLVNDLKAKLVSAGIISA